MSRESYRRRMASRKTEARTPEDYKALAIEELRDDFTVVKDWIWNQFENNRAAFVHSLAEIFQSHCPGVEGLLDIQRDIHLDSYIEHHKSDLLAAKIAELQDNDREDDDDE